MAGSKPNTNSSYLQHVISWVRFNWTELLVIIFILVLATTLRWHNYATFPSSETLDERAWTYLGASLLSEGVPASWSFFGAYNPDYIYLERGTQPPLVRPALDHPPLFSLIPGLFHLLTTEHWSNDQSYVAIRFPMVLMGTVAVLLFYLVLRQEFSFKFASAMASIYATAPILVFSSRLALAENLLAILVMLCLWTVHHSQRRWAVNTLAVLSAAAVLTKVAGVIIPLALMYYFWRAGNRVATVKILTGLLVGVLIFFIYGASYNLELFLQIFSSQSGRDIGPFTILTRWLLHPTLVRDIFTDGWLITGVLSWLAAIWLQLTRRSKAIQLAIILLTTHVVFILTAVGQLTMHGWYDYTIYPALFLVIAHVVWYGWSRQDRSVFQFLSISLLPLFGYTIAVFQRHLIFSSSLSRLLVAGPVLSLVLTPRNYLKLVLYGAGVAVLLANVLLVWLIDARIYDEIQRYFLTLYVIAP